MKIALLLQAVIFSGAQPLTLQSPWPNADAGAAEFVPNQASSSSSYLEHTGAAEFVGQAYYYSSVPPESSGGAESVPGQITGTSPLLSLEDLAGGDATGPLSMVFFDLTGNKLDLETAASIAWKGFFPNLFKTGKHAGVFNQKARVEIKSQARTEMVPQLSATWFVSTGKKYRVESFDVTVTAPCLRQVPAVCKLFRDQWRQMKRSMLFRDDVADDDVIVSEELDLPHNQHVSSPEARHCIKVVVEEILEKFDLSQKLTHRSIFDPTKLPTDPTGGLVSIDLCAGGSVFSIHTKLYHSLPFNPIEERPNDRYQRPTERFQALYAVVLHGRNAITRRGDRGISEVQHGFYSNFLAVKIFDDGLEADFTPRRASTKGCKIVYSYPAQMDDIRQDSLPCGTCFCYGKGSATTSGWFPYCPFLSTAHGVLGDFIENHPAPREQLTKFY